MEEAKLVLEYIKVLVWPSIVLFAFCYFREQVTGVLKRLKSAKLPGGVTLEMNDEIREAQKLSVEVSISGSEKKEEHKDKPIIPLNEANSRLLELGLSPSPSGMNMEYYRDIAQSDPRLSLAGLRMEVDLLAKNLAKGFKVPLDAKRDNGGRLLKKLLESGSITDSQYQLATRILNLCNRAVHGEAVTHDQALLIINSADVLIDDYLSWMSWGFDDNWKRD